MTRIWAFSSTALRLVVHAFFLIERRQEQWGATLLEFNVLYINSRLRRQALFWDQKIWIPICRARDTEKTVRQYQKDGRNNEARRSIWKCSYSGHRVSEFNFLYINPKLRRQALFWDQNIWILICKARDTEKPVRQYEKNDRNNEARRCIGKRSYPGHPVSELNFSYINSKLRRPASFWYQKIWIPICRGGDTAKTVRQYQKDGRNNDARRCIGKCLYPRHPF